MSDVTPLTPPDTPKTPPMTITNFNYEGSYLPGLICNIVVKADLGRSPGRSNPPAPVNASWHRYYGYTGSYFGRQNYFGQFPPFPNNRLVNIRCLEVHGTCNPPWQHETHPTLADYPLRGTDIQVVKNG